MESLNKGLEFDRLTFYFFDALFNSKYDGLLGNGQKWIISFFHREKLITVLMQGVKIIFSPCAKYME